VADKTVKIGRYEYGGLSVRMEYDPQHSHLNANGQKDKATANQRAAWTTVSRPFGRQVFGITLFDHPENYGFPSPWRVDGQGLISPSPPLLGDWTIEPRQEHIFHYRFLVHSGSGQQEQLAAEHKRFAEQRYASPPALPASALDRESVALWNPAWQVICPESEGAPLKLPEYGGRQNVLRTHPTRQTNAVLQRTVDLPPDRQSFLTFAVAPHTQSDWELRVYADGHLLHKQLVDDKGGLWKKVQVDLSAYAGKKVSLRLENAAHNWETEYGYWTEVEIKAAQ